MEMVGTPSYSPFRSIVIDQVSDRPESAKNQHDGMELSRSHRLEYNPHSRFAVVFQAIFLTTQFHDLCMHRGRRREKKSLRSVFGWIQAIVEAFAKMADAFAGGDDLFRRPGCRKSNVLWLNLGCHITLQIFFFFFGVESMLKTSKGSS